MNYIICECIIDVDGVNLFTALSLCKGSTEYAHHIEAFNNLRLICHQSIYDLMNSSINLVNTIINEKAPI